jgi:hypothetical protein
LLVALKLRHCGFVKLHALLHLGGSVLVKTRAYR